MALINYEAVKIKLQASRTTEQSTKSATQNLHILHLYSSEYEISVCSVWDEHLWKWILLISCDNCWCIWQCIASQAERESWVLLALNEFKGYKSRIFQRFVSWNWCYQRQDCWYVFYSFKVTNGKRILSNTKGVFVKFSECEDSFWKGLFPKQCFKTGSSSKITLSQPISPYLF